MATSMKWVLAVVAGAGLLAGCADEPYYGYGYGYDYGAYNYPGPVYYGSPDYAYGPPVVGFGLGFSDFDHHEHWGDRGDHEWREHHEGFGGHEGHEHHEDHGSGG